MNLKSNLGILRLLAVLEGITLLLFAITVPLKKYYDMPTPNRVLGLVHGGLFIAYVIWVFIVAKEKKWSPSIIGISILASFIPFGTFIADHKIFNK